MDLPRCGAKGGFMAGKYNNFRELSFAELEGRDYQISWRRTNSPILLMAVHGGGIEHYTSAIADLIAGEEFSFYTFAGLKEYGNRALHITSTKFDEPQGLGMAENAGIIISIHGEKTLTEEFIIVGGLNKELSAEIEAVLKGAGFTLRNDRPDLRGISAANICNKGRSGQGVQLEISAGLRKRIRLEKECRDTLISVIRRVLLNRPLKKE
ncbi:MAG: poly-gamma-glutamate hydrolase family protein [Peptococcaceae bacterium]